jgi:hypothetical protein
VEDGVDLEVEGPHDIVLHERKASIADQMRDVCARTGEQVVDADDARPFGEEAVAKVRADEAGAPRNQCFHV